MIDSIVTHNLLMQTSQSHIYLSQKVDLIAQFVVTLSGDTEAARILLQELNKLRAASEDYSMKAIEASNTDTTVGPVIP